MKKFLILFGFLSHCSNPVAKVNGIFIFLDEIKDETGIQLAYGANYSEEEIILLLLQKKLREWVVLKKLKIEITDLMLRAEKERIDRETKAPQILNKVKEHFQGNETQYIQRYIYPVLISRILEEKFYFDTLIQSKPYRKAKDRFKKLKENLDIKIENDPYYISPDTLIEREIAGGPTLFSFPVYEMDTLIVKNLSTNEFYPKILEDRGGYYILRKLDREGEKWDGLFFRKEDFNKWFREQIKDVHIKIFDPEKRKRVLLRAKGSFLEGIIQR